MKVKIDRKNKVVVLTFEDPRLRTYEERLPFEVWFKFASEVTKKIAKSHRA